MQEWLEENAWWLGIVLTVLIALFPQAFGEVGTVIKIVIINYWLQASIIVIIIMLVIVCRLLIKLRQAS